MKRDPEARFSEVSLFDGEERLLVHIWSDGSWDPVSGQTRARARRWIQKGYHGDLSEEPQFVQDVIARIKEK
jgi:hypothetical protein